MSLKVDFQATARTEQRTEGRLTLPIFVTAENKSIVGAFGLLLGAVLYLGSNHFHFLEPRLLPMFWIDRTVPFVANTVWIYVSEYIYFITVYWLCRDWENASRLFCSFFTLQVLSVLIFCLWPTTYPRGDFPLPADLNLLTKMLFTTLRQTDTPASCCPSLHVSSVYLCSFVFLREQRSKFKWIFLWSTLIALSTLTTKQHYGIDVVAGLGMAILVYWFFQTQVDFRSSGA